MITNILNSRASTTGYGLAQLSTANNVTDIDAYTLSAIEKNATIPNSLAAQIQTIHDTFGALMLANIKRKHSTLHNIEVDVKSAAGIYYKTIPNFYETIGISPSMIISVRITNWAHCAYLFVLNYNNKYISFSTQVPTTLGDIDLDVLYIS